MNELEGFYKRSKDIFLQAIPSFWPEMYSIGYKYVNRDALPEIIIPAVCCKAVGGNMAAAGEIGAAMLAAAVSMRILDDLEDNDKPDALYNEMGTARTINYVDAFRTVAYKILGDACASNPRYIRILQEFSDCYLIVLAGQDKDLQPHNLNWEEAWKIIEMKTAYIHAAAAAIGAMAGADRTDWIVACKKFGYHTGLAIQLFNDMDGIWSPEGLSDLEQGKITLPLLYALQCEHDAKEELADILHKNAVAAHADRIKKILDAVDAKGYLLWAALQQRDSALKAISPLPRNEGTGLLEAHITGMFGDIEELSYSAACNR